MARDFRYDTESEPNMRTSSPVSELVEWLLKVAGSERKYGFDGAEAALREAASTLTILSTRNAELEAENARLQARVAEFEKAMFSVQVLAVSSAACWHQKELENVLTKIEQVARRVREGGEANG